jgi:hypothetical protein
LFFNREALVNTQLAVAFDSPFIKGVAVGRGIAAVGKLTYPSKTPSKMELFSNRRSATKY